MYSGENYEFLFNEPGKELTENAFETLKHSNVMKYRTKTITSGNIVECEIYPIWNTKSEATKAKEAAENKSQREAQKNLDEKNAKKKIIRLVNTNFNENDTFVTLTYKDKLPDEEQARKDVQNYIRRVKAYRKKHGLPEMKYIYVIEYQTETGRKKKRIHHHIIMSRMDRDDAEKLWPHGWANTKRLQPDEYGFEAISRYMVKDPQGKKRWSGSRNLDKPKETVSDTKFTKRMAEKLLADFDNAAPIIFSKIKQFKDLILNDWEIKRSDFVAGAYVYAKMRKEPQAEPKTKRGRGQRLNI